MESAIYFVVAVAIAASILILAVPYLAKWPSPLDRAYALAYIVPKPLNSNAVWIGVKAAYSDVTVKYVSVGGVFYTLNTAVPYGSTVWLNYSGSPLVAKCGQVLVLATAHGSGLAAMRFVVQCPQMTPKTAIAQIVDVAQMVAFANGVLNWYATMDAPKLAATVDPANGKLVLKNIGDIPLLVWLNNSNIFGMPYLFLAPGQTVEFGGVGQAGVQSVSDYNSVWSKTYYADVRLENGRIVGWVDGIPVNATPQWTTICVDANASADFNFNSWRWTFSFTCLKWETIYGTVFEYISQGGQQWPLLAFKVDNGVLYVGHSGYNPTNRLEHIVWSPAPWREQSTYVNIPPSLSSASYRWTLYVYPAQYVTANTTIAGAVALSPFRKLQIEMIPVPGGWAVQWPNRWSANASNVTSAFLPPGGYAAVPIPSSSSGSQTPVALYNTTGFPFVVYATSYSGTGTKATFPVAPVLFIPGVSTSNCPTLTVDIRYVQTATGKCTITNRGDNLTFVTTVHSPLDTTVVNVYLNGKLVDTLYYLQDYWWDGRTYWSFRYYSYSGSVPVRTTGVVVFYNNNGVLEYYGAWTGSTTGHTAITVMYAFTTRGAQIYSLTYQYNLPCGNPASGYAYALLQLYYNGSWVPTSFGLINMQYREGCPSPHVAVSPLAPSCPVEETKTPVGQAFYDLQQTSQGYTVDVKRTYQVTKVDCYGHVTTYNETATIDTIQTKTNVLGIYDRRSDKICGISDVNVYSDGYVGCS